MSINWSNAPAWAQWVAKDGTGEYFWYRMRPSVIDVFGGVWQSIPYQETQTAGFVQDGVAWQDSLRMRPGLRKILK